MGGGACVVIIEGGSVQGNAARLAQTAFTSCQLIDYLENDKEANFDIADGKPIQDFHLRAKVVIDRLNDELDKLNRALAQKYNR